MNTSNLKRFAPACRTQLISQIEGKLNYVLTAKTPDLSAKEALVNSLRQARDREGAEELVERIAYTWFNRFTAFRFLDAHNWHPFKLRVLTSSNPDNIRPDLLQQVLKGILPEELTDFVPMERVNKLLNGEISSSNPEAEVQHLLIIGVSAYYSAHLHFLFKEGDAFTELLLPDDLLTEHSVLHGFTQDISDADCEQVEVLGWLYQFYISEKKDAVMALKKAVQKEDIPAVTQLFTPHWIVRYMVENSLGKLWLQNRPHSRLRKEMDYYIPEPEGQEETDFLKISTPEEIKLIDPACGSAHILTYAFDLLFKIYEEEGYSSSEIPSLILQHNLYGVEIDERAASIAYLALIMKAQQYYPRFLRKLIRSAPEEKIVPNICCLQEVSIAKEDLKLYIDAFDLGDLFPEPVVELMHQFEHAKNFGSLIQPAVQDVSALRQAMAEKDITSQLPFHNDSTSLSPVHKHVMTVLDQAEMLTQKYHCAVLNPPYMNKFNGFLKSFIESNFKDYKSDLFSAFMIRSKGLALPGGQLGFMTPFVWMFISSYEKLRSNILNTSTLTSLIQLEYSGFDGATVPICTFTIANRSLPDYKGGFVRLSDFKGSKNQAPKALEAIKNPDCGWFYRASGEDFEKIPSSPVSYWLGEKIISNFEILPKLSDVAEARGGMTTANNELFLRLWYEVAQSKRGSFPSSEAKWFPYNKGGAYRKWYGNQEWVVNWKNKGQSIKESGRATVRSENLYGHPMIGWTDVTSYAQLGVRFYEQGFLFDASGPAVFAKGEELRFCILSFLSTKFSSLILQALNPTLHIQAGNIADLPWKKNLEDTNKQHDISNQAISISRKDWHAFETSWGFNDHPLLDPEHKGYTLEESWKNWNRHCQEAIAEMKGLEEENNRLWIEAYGLQEELKPEVPEEEITLARADVKEDMASFISYAVGCMFGRYSLDQEGLVLANVGETYEDYLEQIPVPSFEPDDDNIIPVLDAEWFEDDIVARFREFLKVTFGADQVEANIAFIEQALERTLRDYFTKDFYTNHLSNQRKYGYKKRPIYWMFQSPKKHFRALIYMHRYNRDTVNRLLNGYLREYRHKLTHRKESLERKKIEENGLKGADRKLLDKTAEAIRDIDHYEREILLPLAQEQIEIDLDDGVKVNYPKFGKALVKI